MLERGPFRRLVKSKYPEVNADEAWAYRTLKRPEVYLGDMYWYLYLLESLLHTYIKVVLLKAYGADYGAWGFLKTFVLSLLKPSNGIRNPFRSSSPGCKLKLAPPNGQSTLYAVRADSDLSPPEIAAWAAARRAMGTR